MSTTMFMIWVILASALVTLLPRILPFIIVRKMKLPKIVLKWLSYIPICILSALVIENVLIKADSTITIDSPVVIAMIPTLLIAIWSKSLALTVIIGIISMGMIRLIV